MAKSLEIEFTSPAVEEIHKTDEYKALIVKVRSMVKVDRVE